MNDPKRWKRILGMAGGIFLGAVLLVAAGAKALEPGAFAEQIHLEGLDSFFSASTVALIALALETGVGLALLLGVRHRWLLILTSFLVVFFVFLTGRNYWLVAQGLRDPDASCGCFGSLVNRTPAEAFWQDLLLLVPPLVLAFWGRTAGALPRKRLTVAFALSLGITLFVWQNPDLYLTELAAQVVEENLDESFSKTNEYGLTVDGREEPAATIYHSEALVAFLIQAPQLRSPVLLKPRTSTVEVVDLSESVKKRDGRFYVSPVVSQPSGKFELTADGIAFNLDGHKFRMSSR